MYYQVVPEKMDLPASINLMKFRSKAFACCIRAGVGLWILVGGTWPLASQEMQAIPQAYALERYESGWNTNPFTLKTAPVAVKKESFAKDLALGSMFKLDDVTTVVLVNTKTRDRIKIVSDQVSSEGYRIKSATILDSRKDSYAEIEKGGEIAVMRYDNNLMKQLAAQGTAANMVSNGLPGQPQPQGMASLPRNIPPQAAREAPQPPISAGEVGAINNTMENGHSPSPPIGGMQAPTPPGAGNPGVPAPQRRRLLTAPTTPQR